MRKRAENTVLCSETTSISSCVSPSLPLSQICLADRGMIYTPLL